MVKRVMAQSRKRPLFRETALQQYMRNQEKDVLPRIITPPVFLCGWILLGLFILSGVIAWSQSIPVFASGSAFVLPTGEKNSDDPTTILLLLPADTAEQIQTGEHCHIRVRSVEPYLPCTITSVQPGLQSPETVLARYQLDDIQLARPMLVAEAKLETALPEDIHPEDRLKAQVQIGTQRLLTLLPGFDSLPGGA